ncbi:MAG TPA: hypothetical protein VF631_09600 [Allosphingosinicella sp.]|uniref:hypothetical protein n=1 Tax=Allosphingosinicella sp. TaxID=2823234 RepID=UPI002F277326
MIGVAVANENGFHVEMANALDRLRCLYADDAEGVAYAIDLTADHLRLDIGKRGVRAIVEPQPLLSGVEIGMNREAEGASFEAIAASWMRSLSSLYRNEQQQPFAADEAISQAEGVSDQLPVLVMDYVRERREGFFNYFSADLREGRRRRVTGRSHEVLIDFGGSRLVANFGTLRASGIARSVNLIKRRLWDLKVERDRDPQSALLRQHEMIIQSPAKGDPQVTANQQTYLSDALAALEQQADQEQLRLRPLSSVPEIGEHVLRVEAAQAAI